jgi:chemotaxis protein MotB
MAGAEKGERPIIIVKRRKRGAAAHHGGAWKVAYADFVTAMMAFFLVLWLVATISKEQRAAIFEYFKNPSMEPGKSSKPAPGQMGPGGASTSAINLHGGLDAPKTSLSTKDHVGSATDPPSPLPPGSPIQVPKPTPEEARKIAEADEEQKLNSLLMDLRHAVAESPSLRPFQDQLLLDITPEGLRIQIVDEQNRAMFDIGSSRLKDYTDRILRELASYLNTVPNRISLTGHTDITPYGGRSDYSNWELSADRANSARRALLNGGLRPEKIARVVGLSSAILFDKDHPSDPINRRISIVVMTKRAEEAALKTDQPPQHEEAVETAHDGAASGAPAALPTAASPAPPASPGLAPPVASPTVRIPLPALPSAPPTAAR